MFQVLIYNSMMNNGNIISTQTNLMSNVLLSYGWIIRTKNKTNQKENNWNVNYYKHSHKVDNKEPKEKLK